MQSGNVSTSPVVVHFHQGMPKTEGHSETVDADSISLLQLEKIINKVIKGLQE